MPATVFPPKAELEAEITKTAKLFAFKTFQRRGHSAGELVDLVEVRWSEFRDMAIDFIATRYAVAELEQ